jgi:hypothetical protein
MTPTDKLLPGSSRGPQRAATTLLKTMIDANTPTSVKVRAAEAIFNHAAKAIEIKDRASCRSYAKL